MPSAPLPAHKSSVCALAMSPRSESAAAAIKAVAICNCQRRSTGADGRGC